jgi:hypothetical protein
LRRRSCISIFISSFAEYEVKEKNGGKESPLKAECEKKKKKKICRAQWAH